jgi:hypothetical protein
MAWNCADDVTGYGYRPGMQSFFHHYNQLRLLPQPKLFSSHNLNNGLYETF